MSESAPSLRIVPGGRSGVAFPEPFTARHLIGGKWHEGGTGEIFDRVSPAHGTVVSRSCLGGANEAANAVAAASEAFHGGPWRRMPGRERAAVIGRCAELIVANCEKLALLETLESGKPLSQARAEIVSAADIWRYACALARTVHGDSRADLGDGMLGLVLKEPVGVVVIITPWNFPFLIVSQTLPFALAAGCTVAVKPSELTPSTTVMLGELLMEAGLPAGVVNIVLGRGDPAGAALAKHEDVAMVSFTGSTSVGRSVGEAAAATFKRVSLELGGNNPQAIFPDADFEDAAAAVVFGVCYNAGQCCNSGSRVLLHEDVAEKFVSRVVDLARQVPFGDPLHSDTKVGPIVTAEHAARIDKHVKSARDYGATFRLGGRPLKIDGLDGQFYEPTILTDVTADMSVVSEEVFGPVLCVQTFSTADEALRMVNDTRYGLSAGVWSASVHTCLEFVRGVRAGTVWTNTWMDGFAELPFGGVGKSGIGRELGRHGLDEFLELKTVQMRSAGTRENWL